MGHRRVEKEKKSDEIGNRRETARQVFILSPFYEYYIRIPGDGGKLREREREREHRKRGKLDDGGRPDQSIILDGCQLLLATITGFLGRASHLLFLPFGVAFGVSPLPLAAILPLPFHSVMNTTASSMLPPQQQDNRKREKPKTRPPRIFHPEKFPLVIVLATMEVPAAPQYVLRRQWNLPHYFGMPRIFFLAGRDVFPDKKKTPMAACIVAIAPLLVLPELLPTTTSALASASPCHAMLLSLHSRCTRVLRSSGSG